MMKIAYPNKVITKTILFLFLFLATILFFECTPTMTRYEEEVEEVLKYQSTIALQKEEEKGAISLISLNEKEAVMEFSLLKDQKNAKQEENSSYKVLLPTSCEMDQTEDIVFAEGVEEKKIQFTCNLETSDLVVEKEGEKFLELSLQVLESVNNEMYFLYKEYDCSEKIETKAKNGNEEDTKIVAFKQSLLENILTNAYYQPYEKEITTYITDALDPLHLLGLQIDYQEYYQYNYIVEDSFIGYARTYYENKDKENKNTMYFTETTPNAIDDTFSYYLKEYYCSTNIDQYYVIMNYIASVEKISDVILNGKTISGITYSKNDQKITIEDTINEQLELLINEETTMIYHADEEQQKGTFFASMNKNQTISSTLKEQLKQTERLIEAILQDKQNSSTTIEYFEINDGKDFVAIEISRAEDYNKITIVPITITEEETNYYITIDCNKLDTNYLDVQTLINLMRTTLQIETENNPYQLTDNILSFELKKPVITTPKVSSEEQPQPPIPENNELEQQITEPPNQEIKTEEIETKLE